MPHQSREGAIQAILIIQGSAALLLDIMSNPVPRVSNHILPVLHGREPRPDPPESPDQEADTFVPLRDSSACMPLYCSTHARVLSTALDSDIPCKPSQTISHRRDGFTILPSMQSEF